MKILFGISATVFEVAAKHDQDAQVVNAAHRDETTSWRAILKQRHETTSWG